MHSTTRRQFLVDGGKVVVGASALAAFLAACGDSGAGAASGTLNYWVTGYQPHGANKTGKLTDAAAAAYKKAHASLKDVKATGYTGDQAGFTKVTQAVRGGTTIDLFRYPSDNLPLLVKQGLVAPIDEYLSADDKADFYPDILKSVTIDGKIYAWPLWVPPVAMYLNVDLFKERGIELPKDDWTYEEFVDIAQRLTFKRSNGQQVYGYTGAIDPDLVNTWSFLLGDGATPLSEDNKKYTLNTQEGVSGLQKLVDLAHKYKVTPPDFGTQSPDDIGAGFSQNKNYAMYSAPSGDSSGYRQLGLNFEIRPMPIGKRNKPFTVGGVGLIVVGKHSNKDQEKLAMDFANYLTGKQVATDVNGYYLAPGARKSITVLDPISKFSPVVASTYFMPLIAQWSQIRTLIHSQLQNAVLGKSSAQEALNAPADEINSILSGNA